MTQSPLPDVTHPVKWSIVARFQAIGSSFFLMAGGIVAVLYPNWIFGVVSACIGLLLLFLEWPIWNLLYWTTLTNFKGRGFVYILLVVPGVFAIPTLLGSVFLLTTSFAYLQAGWRNEKPVPPDGIRKLYDEYVRSKAALVGDDLENADKGKGKARQDVNKKKEKKSFSRLALLENSDSNDDDSDDQDVDSDDSDDDTEDESWGWDYVFFGDKKPKKSGKRQKSSSRTRKESPHSRSPSPKKSTGSPKESSSKRSPSPPSQKRKDSSPKRSVSPLDHKRRPPRPK